MEAVLGITYLSVIAILQIVISCCQALKVSLPDIEKEYYIARALSVLWPCVVVALIIYSIFYLAPVYVTKRLVKHNNTKNDYMPTCCGDTMVKNDQGFVCVWCNSLMDWFKV